MTRVELLAAVLWIGLLAGCRAVPNATVAGPGAATDPGRPFEAQPARSPLRPVVFVEGEVDGAAPADGQRELLPLATSAAADAEPLGLTELESLALQSNPSLAAAAARLDAARGTQFQAGRLPNPVVGYHATEVGNQGTAGQQGAFVSQRFITAGKLQLDQAITAREIDTQHFRFHAQELRVLSDVRLRFYESLVAARRVELTTALADIGDDLVEATTTLLQQRLVAENDLLQAELRTEEARILLDNARQDHLAAWRRLTAVVGQPGLPLRPLAGDLDADLPQLDWDSACATQLAGNPRLDAARMAAARAELALERARREPIPNVDLSVSLRHHNVTRDDVANVQVGIPIPVFDKNQGNIRRAQAEWLAAQHEVRRIQLDLQDRLAMAHQRYSKARQQVIRYRERLLPKAQKSLQLVTQGYKAKQVEYLTLLTAQQTHLQVNLAYLDALQTLWSASAVLDGQLLSGSLSDRP